MTSYKLSAHGASGTENEAETLRGANPYDEVPYPSHPFPQTHPDRLACVARLFGMRPHRPDDAKILEIGCASGGNLIPMADQLQSASLLGIDASAAQIKVGREAIDRLGLQHVELRHLDVREASEQLGEFDYIICHGVYSWVPAEVQQAILAVCRDHLAPQGVAHISYNTYPGWHFRGMIRDMMCYHVGQFDEPSKKAQQARALLKFLADSVSGEQSSYGMLLRSELELLGKQSDGYLLHDHLEADNHPCYFHQFMSAAGDLGLQYLGDSSVSSMWIGNFPPDVATTLTRIAPDIIQREQYTDFVRNRFFRQSLLVHANVELNRNLGPDSVEPARLAGRLLPDEGQTNVDLNPTVEVAFTDANSTRKLRTKDPMTKAMLVRLANAWPASIPFEELFRLSRQSLGANRIEEASRVDAARRSLATQIIQMFVAGVIDLTYEPDRFTLQPGDRPRLSAVARDQAAREGRMTSQRHELVQVDDFIRHLAPAMDGERDLDSLVDYVAGRVESGVLVVQRPDEGDAASLRTLLAGAVRQAIDKLGRQALLVPQ